MTSAKKEEEEKIHHDPTFDKEDPEIGTQSKPDHNDTNEEKDEREFPSVFYCPITNQLIKDPVVVPDGLSYERKAIENRGDVPLDKLYPNRALKSVIDETTTQDENDSFRAGIKRLQDSVRQNISQLWDIPSVTDSKPLPEAYFCPITFSLIHDPVIDPEGNTFERIALENWIQVNRTSPITRTSVSTGDLYPNNAVAELMDVEKGKCEESMHPSIKLWKEESPPQRMDPPETISLDSSSPTHTLNAPITPSELEERRWNNRQMRTVSSTICFALFVACLVLALLFGGVRTFIISLAVLGMCVQDSFSRVR